ncbi:MAG: hypothetical protein J7L44_03340 [Candidatus Diapherotrites archaeon]|nr:hypothetical protein [Candidatus Diapherotrites archaeon]
MFLICSASAYIYMLAPREATLQNNESTPLKYVQPGETLVFVINRKSDSLVWDSINVSTSWPSAYEVLDKTITVRLTIPSDEQAELKSIKFTLIDNESGVEENFDAVVFLRHDLIEASLAKSFVECQADSIAKYELLLRNNSLAEHTIEIKSSLPETLFEGTTITLRPNESRALELEVSPGTAGFKEFKFYVDSTLFDKRFAELNAEMRALPSLQTKYTASLYAIPFFSFSLLPSYLLNAFLALL